MEFKNHSFRKKLSRNVLVSPIKKGVCEKFWTLIKIRIGKTNTLAWLG